MDTSSKVVAALALNRFGMGPRLGSIAAIAADPRGAVLADLDRPRAGELVAPGLPSSGQAFRTVADANAERRARQITMAKAEEAKGPAEPSMREGGEATANATAAKMAAEAVPNPGRQIYLNEAKARIDAALGSEIGFVERLVWFWSNHFCVSADKIQSMSGAYEREAVRPHVLGRFQDMLAAVESHPAMLFYLDNTVSIGPNSVAGINRTRGLNENLAREILELHTLGVRSVYTQEDVVRFANVLTGWSCCRRLTIPITAASSSSIDACTSRARKPSLARSIRRAASSREKPCSTISRAILPPPSTSPASSPVTLLPTCHPDAGRGWRGPSRIRPGI